MSRWWVIFQRELLAHCQSPIIYIMLSIYLALVGYFFSAYIIVVQTAAMRDVLSNMAIIFLFMAPAFTARLWTEEVRNGTGELLLTAPTSPTCIILSKYTAAGAVCAAALFLTGLFPAIMSKYGNLDWPAVFTGYFGLGLLGATALAAGLYASTLTDSQAAAAAISFGMLLGLWAVGWIGAELPATAGHVVEYIGLIPHYEDFSRGIIDSRHLVYFLTLITGFLVLSAQRLAGQWLGRTIQAGLSTFGIVVILITTNGLAARHYRRWDLTAEQSFGLSEATKQVMGRGLMTTEPIRAFTFFSPGSPEEDQVVGLLREYALLSGGRLSYERINPVTRPSLVQQFNVFDYGTIVLTMGNRLEKIEPWELQGGAGAGAGPIGNGETALTNAILQLTRQAERAVYFLTGHGEMAPAEFAGPVHAALTAAGYSVRPLNLARTPEIPADADLVAVIGPGYDLSSVETESLLDYTARRGGHLLILVDPPSGAESFPNLRQLISHWGLGLGEGIILDPERNYLFDAAAPIPVYVDHPITAPLTAAGLAMVLPGARPLVELTPNAAEFTVRHWPILQTSQGARVNTSGGNAEHAGATPPGPPFILAVAAETARATKVSGRLVLVGSAAFATDSAWQIQGNLDFFLSAIRWTAGYENTILPIETRSTIHRDLLLTGRDVRFVAWITMFALPLSVALAGGGIWLRRRYL